MRVCTLGAGAVLAAAILLTGCTAGTAPAKDDTAEKQSTTEQKSTTDETTTPPAGCPELAEGLELDGRTVIDCWMAARADTAGYVQKFTIAGVEKTEKHNLAEDAVRVDIESGSTIAIGDDVWVKPKDGEWQVADTNSTDPTIRTLSSMGENASKYNEAPATAPNAELTVTGTGTRLGQEVFIVTGTVEAEGSSADVVYELTAGWVPLAMESTSGEDGFKATIEITEWDVEQDIKAPM